MAGNKFKDKIEPEAMGGFPCRSPSSRLQCPRLGSSNSAIFLWGLFVCLYLGAGSVGGRDDGVLTTSVVGCGRPADSEGVDLRIVDTEVCGTPLVRAIVMRVLDCLV